MSWSRSLLFAVAALAAVACRDSGEASSAGSARAVPALDVRDMPEAVAASLESARAAAVASPASAAAWGHLGAVLDAHGLHESALECYTVARELDPQDFRWAYFGALMRSFLGGDPAAIAAAFEEALALRGDHAPIHFHHGQALLRLGDAEAAKAAYTKAILLAPGLGVAHRGLGQAELLLDRPQEARRALEIAVELDPEDSAALASLARALRLLGDDAAAAPLEARAQEREPRLVLDDPVRYEEVDLLAVDPLTCLRRAEARMVAGDFEQALADLETAADSAPDEPDVTYRLALCRERLGDLGGALEALETTLSLAPDYPGARRDLARLRVGVGYLKSAREIYDELVAEDPDDPRLLRERAELRYRLADYAGAVADFERADALEPSPSPIHHNWGAALGQLGRTDEAIEHLEQALELDPQAPKARELIELLRARAVPSAEGAPEEGPGGSGNAGG